MSRGTSGTERDQHREGGLDGRPGGHAGASPLPAILALLLALSSWVLQALWILWDQGPPDSDDWHHITKAEALYRA